LRNRRQIITIILLHKFIAMTNLSKYSENRGFNLIPYVLVLSCLFILLSVVIAIAKVFVYVFTKHHYYT
jgi:hypothetical protein